MSSSDTYRLRGSLRQRRRNILTLQAAYLRSRVCAIVLAVLLALAGATPIWAQANPAVEYQVQAAFLYNFTKFVAWPAGAFHGEKSPIILCVFKHDPFGSALDEVIRGKAINIREVLARRISELPDLKSGHLVFVGSVENKHLSEVLSSLKGTSALVVREGESFAERGGGIQFFPEANKLRFAANVDAVHRASRGFKWKGNRAVGDSPKFWHRLYSQLG